MQLDLLGPIKSAFSFIFAYWWLYAPVLFTAGLISSWVFYITQKYLLTLKWVLLEIKPPAIMPYGPKVAENIFSGLHSSYLQVRWKKRFFEGKVPNWYSLEIVSNGGDIKFYVRAQEEYRTLIEHQIFAQYPDAEIKVVDDYVMQVPAYLPNDDYDLFGADLVFTADPAYPIKTYPFFEEPTGKDEYKQIDTIAPLAEVLSALEPGEHIWLQYVIRPTGPDWVKRAQGAIDKILEKDPKVDLNILQKTIDFVDKTALEEILRVNPAVDEKKEKKEFNLQKLTPGKKFVLEQLENKIAKLGFKSTIRFIYLARKELFHRSHISSVIGMFKQLYSNALNSFRPDMKTITVAKGILHHIFPSEKGFFVAQQEYKRKRNIVRNYRRRAFSKSLLILNTEELATLFHLPGQTVKAPALPRVEAKKGQPPPGLPTM